MRHEPYLGTNARIKKIIADREAREAVIRTRYYYACFFVAGALAGGYLGVALTNGTW